jgi:CRP/FNR family cyclic AMP-dependent transcriptional regulator
MELVQILRSVELFQGLSAPQFERLASLGQRLSFGTDEEVFHQGSVGDRMYVIVGGQVEIHFDQAGVPPLYLGSGQIVGEMALLDQGTRSATVISVADDTEVYSITNTDLMALCQQDTAIGFILMRNMALDLSFKLRVKNLGPTTTD